MRRITALSAAVITALSLNAQASNLSDIYQDALANDQQLKIAKAQLEAVYEDEEIARAGMRTSVSAGGSLNRNERDGKSSGNNISTGYNSLSASLNVTHPLYNEGKSRQIGVAEASTEQAELTYASSEMDLIVRVTEAFFAVLRAKDTLNSSLAQEKAINRQLEQAQQQFKVGLIPITGVNEAQAAYDAARAARIGAEGDLLISEEALQLITGKSYDNLNALSEDFPVASPKPVSVQYWIDLALDNSPEVKAAYKQKDAAELSVGVAKAALKPFVDAKASLAHQYQDTSQETSLTDLALGVEMGWQIYTGGSTSANIRKVGHALNQAAQSLELQKRSAALNARSYYIQVTTSVQQVEARRQALISSESALKATRSGYEVGTRNIVDVLQAEQAFYTAETAYLDTRYSYIVSLIKLKQAAGVLKPEDIAALDQWLQS
ncbi:TolC family outer membrane protein [Oceanospirillum sediminis]|uniref:TolC family outer membrane protein n=1 Tax=Oceanospirillum sediminis TaxID=2760088 RepID=A0A839INC9_9GAMM|nr:TolC family outer membrane protein [Oceanospirillum sediminis]MBB1486448.1 TolC family outer membrane protein [Oceanospirillum sediminis]